MLKSHEDYSDSHMKKILFSLLACCLLTILSSCVKQKQWTTPFTYQYYDFLPNSNVKSFRTTTYDKKKNAIGSKGYEFDKLGKLIREYSINGSDTTAYITYKYKSGRLVDIIREDGISRKLSYNRYGLLIKVRDFNNYEGEQFPAKTTNFIYDENGLLSERITISESDERVFNSNERDTEWNLKESFVYQDRVRTKYFYEKKDLSNNQHLKYEYDCLENGFVKSLNIYDCIAEKALKTMAFSYKYDERNNWKERITKSKGKISCIEKRDIEYYTSEEMASFDSSMIKDDHTLSRIGKSLTIRQYIKDLKDRLEMQAWDYSGGIVLLIIMLVLTITGMVVALVKMIKQPIFKRHRSSSGMSRIWLYDSSPYLNVLTYFGIVLACSIASILTIALAGGILWLLTWVFKILLWAIIVVGILMLIFGVLMVLGGEEALWGIVIGFIGLLVVSNIEDLKEWGNSAVDWGFAFLKKVNMIMWGYDFIINLWDGIILIVFTPIIIFLLIAGILVLFNSILNGMEWIMTRIYGIRRPCPICGCKHANEYIIGGEVHPVKLQPGTYGIFSQPSPTIGKRIPTMLLNGKGKLDRQCPECGAIIHADAKKTYGTDVHIGFVGHRSSGKSYLLYCGLSTLMKKHSDSIQQIDANQDTRIENKMQRINARQGIQTDDKNKYRAIQLIIKTKLRPIPYHVFFYDVAGEKFNASTSSYKTAMDFYKNVQSIVFVLDPSMIDYSGRIHTSEEIKKWASLSGINPNESYNVDSSFSVLKDVLERVGRKSQKIDFCFVCTKADMGYFEADNLKRNHLSEQEIEKFIRNGLGLDNLVNSAKASFNTIHFFEVSVFDKDTSKLNQLFEFLVKQQGVNL